jgi:phosphoribosyl-ATP pyrophosphohydrolase
MAKPTKKAALKPKPRPKAKPKLKPKVKAKLDRRVKKDRARAIAAPALPPVPPPLPLPEGATSGVLDRLWGVVTSRRDADPAFSHSARLLQRGPSKVAQKFGEEAVECLIEASLGNQRALVAESADVLYHLIVLWVSVGVRPEEVWAELHRREGISGITEKAARVRAQPLKLGPRTRKIP